MKLRVVYPIRLSAVSTEFGQSKAGGLLAGDNTFEVVPETEGSTLIR